MLDGDCASCRMRLGACSFCAHEVIQADIFLIVTSCFGARVHYYAPSRSDLSGKPRSKAA